MNAFSKPHPPTLRDRFISDKVSQL